MNLASDKKIRRNTLSLLKMNDMRQNLKSTLAIIPFSAGIRPNSGSSFKSLEGEDDISPQKYIRKTCFFDIYDEVKYIGQGGQSVIKKIKKISDQSIQAVKICKIKEDDLEMRNNILKEFLNNKSLSHKNILKVHELFISDSKGEIRMVMEYLKLKSLDKVIKKTKLDEITISYIIKNILQGLVYMHNKGICHRDIKPDNILIDWPIINQNNFQVKIIDFGISKNFTKIVCEGLKYYRKSVSMFSNNGTQSYCAPEMFQNNGYKNEFDLWSVGIMTFEMLFGILPFYSEYAGDQIDLILNCKLEFPVPNSVSPIARDFCKRLIRLSCDGRLNAEEALLHPFITINCDKIKIKKKSYGTPIHLNKSRNLFSTSIYPITNRKEKIEEDSEEETKKSKKKVKLDKLRSFRKYKYNIIKISDYPIFLLEKNQQKEFSPPPKKSRFYSIETEAELFKFGGSPSPKKCSPYLKTLDSESLIKENLIKSTIF